MATMAISRVGQNRIHTPYMTVYLVISMPEILCIHRTRVVLASDSHKVEGHLLPRGLWLTGC